jgi:hypothetical protein
MKKRLLLIALAILSAVGSGSLTFQNAGATLAGFKAGSIMDDTVMTDTYTMSVAQIQNFLNSKVSTCDTNGTRPSEMNNSGVPDYNHDGTIQRWEWGKFKYNQTTFPCLKSYKVGSTSSAQLIYNASQAYNINPQTLIVLLQKEAGLVTDTWPLSIQYRTATGYGCPDGAACDSQYYGLTNQLNWAAKLFHSVVTQNPNWYSPYIKGSNAKVYYNPTKSCGYSAVNMTSWTTASLYDYTPYQPNAAALAAGYGTGNSCSSYGNRNFYNYFTDWFGSTTVGQIFQISGSSKTYLKSGNQYFYIPSIYILKAYGFSPYNVPKVSSSTISGLSFAGNLNRIARFGGDDIYLMDGGQRHPFTTRTMYEDTYGYTIGAESSLDASLLNIIPNGSDVTSVVRMPNRNEIYLIDASKKHHISTPNVYNMQGSPVYSSVPTTTLSAEYVGTIPFGTPLLEQGAILNKSDKPYIWNGGTLLGIDDAAINNYHLTATYAGDATAVAQLPTSSSKAPRLISDSGGNKYLVDSGSKFQLTPGAITAMGLGSLTFTTVDDTILAALPTKVFPVLVKLGNTKPVYAVKTGELQQIYSSVDLTLLGYAWSDIGILQADLTEVIPNNGRVLVGDTHLIRIDNGNKVYIVDDNKRLHWIPSASIFSQYGFKMSNVSNLTARQISSYAMGNALGLVTTTDDGIYWIADIFKRWSIPSSLESAYGLPESLGAELDTRLTQHYSASGPITQFLQSPNRPEVYKIIGGQKHLIMSPASLTANGGSRSSITLVSQLVLNNLPTGSQLN